MKTESVARYIIRITFTLLLIAALVAAALALINQVTKPIIEDVNAKKTQEAIALVLPGGYDTEITDFSDATGLVTKVYKGTNGYAVEVAPIGFDNAITMMVGVDFEGKILGISVVSHSETAGLGAVAADSGSKGQAFRDQFIGLSGSASVSKDGGQVDAISGATITSRAICSGVNAALDCVNTLQGGAS